MKSEIGSGMSELTGTAFQTRFRLATIDLRILGAALLRSVDRRGDDRDQFISFLFERRESFRRDDARLLKQFEPEQRFFGLFFNIAEFGEKMRSGFCATSSTVIRSHRRSRPNELCRQRSPRCRFRQSVHQLQDPQRKHLSALFQIQFVHRCSAFSLPTSDFSSTGFTVMPDRTICRRVETTFSPSLSPRFTIRLPSKIVPVSRVRRSIVLSGFTTNAYFTPCCELITLSEMRAARYGVAPATRTRTKKPGVMKSGFQFFRTTRARIVPVPGSMRLSTKSM